MKKMIYDTIIIGNGPAGLSAAIFAARSNLKTIVIGEKLGGQASDAHLIENYPGFPSISGFELMQKFEEHAKTQGVEIIYTRAQKFEKDKKKQTFKIMTGDNEYETRTIILALGTTTRKLNIPGEVEYLGKGVSYCATCDGAFFRDKTIAIVGGGDAALSATLYLAGIAKKIYLIHRRQGFRGEPIKLKNIKDAKNVELVLDTVPTGISGEITVTGLKTRNVTDNQEKQIKLDGVFIEVGSTPTTVLAQELGIKLDEKGYIKVDPAQNTNTPGIFAAGDITTNSNYFRQVITAASEGSVAADSAFKFIREKS
ncbi:MAG: thioredoxin-disulfide reductase [Candidatus Aenigmarchaeota archaeon]|nr:thioredoxin-disulfide reductase [Candidatus Aenigmarchaeota archaeon]